MTGARPRVTRAAALAFACAIVGACSSQGTVASAATGACPAITCTPPDACHVPGPCDRSTGACGESTPRDCGAGRVCDLADGQCHDVCTLVACVASDLCHLPGACDAATGLCGSQTLVTCPPAHTCDPWTGSCMADDPCAAVVCTASDACHVPGACDPPTGLCSAETPVPCPAGTACNPASGLCEDPCLTLICTAPDLCHLPGTCSSLTGQCSPPVPRSCPAGFTCSNASGQCVDLCSGVTCAGGQICDSRNGQCRSPIATHVAKELVLEPPVALAFGPDGALYVAGPLPPPGTYSFDGIALTAVGGMQDDLFVARYDGPAWTARWAVALGDGASQQGRGVAVTSDGTLAVIGNFSGTFSVGTGNLSSASPIDFLAGFSGTSGAGRWASQFDDGTNGQLKTVAANPADASPTHGNRVAVCGFAAGGTPTNLVGSGATAAAGNDLLIGVFSSSGSRLWALQLNSSGSFNEECDAVAVDDDGDVWAAGYFSGASLAFGGATAPLAGPSSTSRKSLWVAKFDGATGAPLASAVFSGSLGNAVPASIAVGSGGVIVAGQFTSNVTFGATTLTAAGRSDAFVAKLDLALAPVWAVRFGGAYVDAASSAALDSFGDVLVTGSFSGTTSGAAVLTAAGSSTSVADAFLLELDGATGATRYASGFGDASTQTGDAVAIDRLGANEFALAGTLNGTIAFPAPAGSVADTLASGNADVYLLLGTFYP